jgi:hypothetical protein
MGCASLNWDPFDENDPGPCIDVVVMNSPDVIEEWRKIGLEHPAPVRMRALVDTGSSITAISKTFANHCKLFQTNEGSEITAIEPCTAVGSMQAPSLFPAPICGRLTLFAFAQSNSSESLTTPS